MSVSARVSVCVPKALACEVSQLFTLRLASSSSRTLKDLHHSRLPLFFRAVEGPPLVKARSALSLAIDSCQPID